MGQKSLKESLEELRGHSRRQRQTAAAEIYEQIKDKPDTILLFLSEIIDALDYPEAQTRWIAFDILTLVTSEHPLEVQPALEAAENSLFDEESAPVRLAAFRFLAAYGLTSEENSDKVWPLLDEAIQCYHGDAEYRDMLKSLLDLAQGSISPETAAKLQERVAFDAESGTGYIQAFSQDITKALDGKAK